MTATDEQIADLFLSGYGIDFVSERGVTGGWTRLDALRVTSQRGWELDKSGRVAVEQRRAPRPPAAMRPGRVLDERPNRRRAPARPQTAAAATTVPPQVVAAVPTTAALVAVPDEEIVEVTAETLYEPEPQAVAELLEGYEEIHRALTATPDEIEALHQVAVDLGRTTQPAPDLLAAGLTHPSARVRKLAREAQAAVDALITAILRRSA